MKENAFYACWNGSADNYCAALILQYVEGYLWDDDGVGYNISDFDYVVEQN